MLWGIALVATAISSSITDWWAKTGGCVAKTPGGDEVDHNIDLEGKAKVWVWQFAIFTVGTLPAVGMTIDTRRHPRF